MTDPPPRFVPLWLACKKCKAEWDDWQPGFVRVEVWLAHVRSLRCPKCGRGLRSRSLRLRQRPLDDPR